MPAPLNAALAKQGKFMNRLSVVGLWVGIIAGIFGVCWSVYTHWSPFDDKLTNSDDFLGIWQSKYSYSITNGTATVNGTTEYFKNGMYNFTGIMIIDSKTNDASTIKVMYDIDGAGEWEHDTKNFYVKLTDSKTYPRFLQIDNRNFDLKEPKFRALVPALEDFIPSNLTEQYVIVDKDAKNIVFELDDPFGKTFSMVLRKVDKRFQRQ